MASARRPTYTSPGRTRQPKSGAGSTSGNLSGTRAPAQPAEPEVISASKTAPAAEQAAPKDKPRSSGLRIRKPSARQPKGAATGANILAFPEPKGRRLKRNILISACTAAALVAGIIAAAIFSPLLAVSTVSVSGTRLLTPDQVQTALEPLKGKPLPQITDEEVDRLLQPLIQIKSVTTQARPPSELVVEVRERVPVALVKQGEQYQLVDVDGVQLATTADPASVSLPVIDGGAGTIGKDLFQATAAVLGALPPEVLAKLSNASAQSVDAVELKLVDGQTIVWGNASEKELKAKVLEALLKVPADPKNPVRVYDVSVPRHPVTR
ncbi:MAG TPA: cell division protein FtsQ/DivIB [Arthrobacter sp.]|nr:cell division protein FtsQ/DivIB [Arthrobacter sp.]